MPLNSSRMRRSASGWTIFANAIIWFECAQKSEIKIKTNRTGTFATDWRFFFFVAAGAHAVFVVFEIGMEWNDFENNIYNYFAQMHTDSASYVRNV